VLFAKSGARLQKMAHQFGAAIYAKGRFNIMSDFRELSDNFLASPQIAPSDLEAAKAQGVALIINNRPDGEEAGQIEGAAIEQAARDLGLDYLAIPVTSAGFSQPQFEAMSAAIAKLGKDNPQAKTLAFCRSGTRSTLLWSLAQASLGAEPEAISASAQKAGYDVSPVRPAMDMMAAQLKS
jgi:uncharacterized protein (TIGR01244 family)